MMFARRAVLIPALVVGAWLGLHGLLLFTLDPSPIDGELADTDSYMRLVRIEELAGGDGWYDSTIERGNAPYGDELHWTRPFDVMVLAMALPLRAALPLHDALFWAGAIICPLLHLALIWAAAWAARPLVPRHTSLVGAMVFVHPAILGQVMPGRLDHHALQLVLFALLVGCLVRLLRGEARLLAVVAGVTAALGVWVSIEMLIPAAALLGALAAAWVAGGRRAVLDNALIASTTAAAGLALALPIERAPADLFAAEPDRLSFMHVFALAAAAVGLWLVRAVGARYQRATSRLALATVVGAVAAVSVAAPFPDLLLGPEGAVDPALRPIWLDKVAEMRPLWPATSGWSPFLLLAGQALILLPASVWLTVTRARRDASGAWAVVIAVAAGELALAMLHARFAAFLAVVSAIVLAAWLAELRAALAALKFPLVARTAWAGAVSGCVAGALVAGAVASSASASTGAELPETCRPKALAEFLEADSRFAGRPLVIAAGIDSGPELLYRTPFGVLAGPYHRNADGILDLHNLYTGSLAGARAIVEERGVDLILVCPSEGENAFLADPQAGSLLHSVRADAVPSWLDPVVLPADLAGRYSLFEVKQ